MVGILAISLWDPAHVQGRPVSFGKGVNGPWRMSKMCQDEWPFFDVWLQVQIIATILDPPLLGMTEYHELCDRFVTYRGMYGKHVVHFRNVCTAKTAW